MTEGEFKPQIERLRETYGARSYPEPRVAILWAEFKNTHVGVFSAIITRLIGEKSQAPMLPEFRTQLAVFREHSVDLQKERYTEDFRQAMSSVSLREYIRKTIDAGNAHELMGLVSLFGIEWVDSRYEKAKKEFEERGGVSANVQQIPDRA